MGSNINAGDMRHIVTWQTFTSVETPGKAGQAVKTWTSQTPQHFAKFEPLTGLEVWNQRQLKATSTTKVTMRDIGPVSPLDRLLLESSGRIFNVDSVQNPEELGADLILMVTELK
jgi:head-tail adaptor